MSHLASMSTWVVNFAGDHELVVTYIWPLLFGQSQCWEAHAILLSQMCLLLYLPLQLVTIITSDVKESEWLLSTELLLSFSFMWMKRGVSSCLHPQWFGEAVFSHQEYDGWG